MKISHKKEAIILLLGDIVALALSLLITLVLRYNDLLNFNIVFSHLDPFIIIFTISILIFFIAGLYEKHTILFKRVLPQTIIKAQAVNIVAAIALFYFFPSFLVAPKTTLFIYLIISSIVVFFWRYIFTSKINKVKKENAIIFASGDEAKELMKEVNDNSRYNMHISEMIDPKSIVGKDGMDKIKYFIASRGINTLIMDSSNKDIYPYLSSFYSLMFSGMKFIDMHEFYEEIFNRIPVSLIGYDWFLSNISFGTSPFYSFSKRGLDLVISIVCFVLSLVFYPFVILAIKLDDGGPIFITQERVGKNGGVVKIYKFRTMSGNDNGVYNKGGTSNLKVTRVGSFLRKSRIDEFPQFWNVIMGNLSLIGPRPELPSLVAEYEGRIPYFKVRNLVNPGLSGWAQIYQENHPHHGVSLEDTANKLSFDLYYLKHRSIFLDLKIILSTIRIFFKRAGR